MHTPPQSQSFSQSYGSILPTSLTYILLSTRGYSPWRPDAVSVRPDMTRHKQALGFSRVVAREWIGNKFLLCRVYILLSSQADSKECRTNSKLLNHVKKKRQLFPFLAPTSPSFLSLPIRLACSGTRMLTCFPFAG